MYEDIEGVIIIRLRQFMSKSAMFLGSSGYAYSFTIRMNEVTTVWAMSMMRREFWLDGSSLNICHNGG